MSPNALPFPHLLFKVAVLRKKCRTGVTYDIYGMLVILTYRFGTQVNPSEACENDYHRLQGLRIPGRALNDGDPTRQRNQRTCFVGWVQPARKLIGTYDVSYYFKLYYSAPHEPPAQAIFLVPRFHFFPAVRSCFVCEVLLIRGAETSDVTRGRRHGPFLVITRGVNTQIGICAFPQSP